MSTLDQLEIISTSGVIEFFDLDPTRGVTSIGRHPDNDIVLNSPGVALFHAMLDHRQKPYHFLLLSHDGSTSLGGRLLPANTSNPIQTWDNIQLDGYTLILVEGASPVVRPGPPVGAPPSRQTAPTRPPTGPLPTAAPPPTTRPEAPYFGSYIATPLPLPPPPGASTPPPTANVTSLPPDHTDEVIVTELSGREWTANVEQTITFQTMLINGGDIVANFVISVEGLDESWVVVSPPYVNLNEGERATVTIAIAAPRSPSSRAGAHHFAVVVTSPNYPRRYSQRGATLTLNPYYDFAVGELDPKQQTISWFQRAGEARVTINNKGNCDTFFRLEGVNDERACSFEFQVPGESVGLAQQAELRLMPEETVSIPVRIAPYARRLVGLRKRNYAYTITTTAVSAQQTPRSLLGQLGQKPLLGPLPLALMGLLLLALIIYIFLPTIYLFSAEPQMVRSGEEVKLRWRGATFTNLRIDNGVGPLPGTVGEVIVAPKTTTIYRLNGDNWLSTLSASWFGAVKEVTVEVEPVKPIIRVFSVDKESLLSGEDLTISWEVLDAEELVLQTNGSPETILSTEHTSERLNQPTVDTTYTLIAKNTFGEVTDSLSVKVTIPTQTPVPTPFVKKFIANPSVIVVGTPVIVEWDVEGADVVSVQPIGGNLPPIQSVSQSPQENITYVLNAAKGSSAIQPIAVQVFVTPAPTATPEPEAPVIEYFQVSDDTVIIGGNEDEDNGDNVVLSWSVLGTVTDVQISNPDLGTVTDLLAKGTLDVVINDKRNFFVLTAFNGDKKSSKTVQLSLETPTATTTPLPPTPTGTATPIPPVVEAFEIVVDSPQIVFRGGEPPLYEIQEKTDATFRWQVNAASVQAVLASGGSPIGQGVPIGEQTEKIDGLGKKISYVLTAENNQGQKASKTIVVLVTEQDPPNPPFNVTGTEQLNVSNQVQWEWTFDPSKQDITKFRIYRADVSGTNFTAVGERPRNQGQSTFNDPLGSTCGKAYYVVGVYKNSLGVERETIASAESWYSGPC